MKTFVAVAAWAFLAALVPAQIMRHGELRAADRAVIQARGGAAAAHWIVDAGASSGVVTRINGRIPLEGTTDAERCADLVATWGQLFDLTPAVRLSEPRLLHTSKTTGSRFYEMPQEVNGFKVAGHGLYCELAADGSARCVHGALSAAAAALPPAAVDVAQAIRIADAHLAAQGYLASDWKNPPHLFGAFVNPLLRGLRPFWRIGAVSKAGLPLAVDVDALDGTVLAQFENAVNFGEGTFKHDGAIDSFETANAKGVVYKDFKSAAAGKSTLQTLPEVSAETVLPGLAEDGDLFGRFALLLNFFAEDDLQVVPGDNHKWLGFPSDSSFEQSDLFEATNCYFHLTKYALAMTKLVGGPLPTDFSMPTAVNTPVEPGNAFFSPDQFVNDWGWDLGTGPGYMLFGDDSYITGHPADDFARDPTVMCHEYTHAIVFFFDLFFGFLDPGDSPAPAVNEAIADYFAVSYFKDPRIGFPLAQVCSAEELLANGMTKSGGLRNLAAPRTLVDNLGDVLDLDGFIEEHDAGHIFGCSLFRMHEVLKQKTADAVMIDSIFNWPQSLTELGFTEYTLDNQVEAHIVYFAACLQQFVIDTANAKGFKTALKALGALQQNGCVGSIVAGKNTTFGFSDVAMVVDLSLGGSFTMPSAFLGSDAGHVLGIAVNSGQSISITLTGDKKANTKVALQLSEPEEGALSFPNDPVVTPNKVSVKGIEVNQGGIVLLFIVNDGVGGLSPQPYKLSVKVKS